MPNMITVQAMRGHASVQEFNALSSPGATKRSPPISFGDTAPGRMAGVTLHSHVRYEDRGVTPPLSPVSFVAYRLYIVFLGSFGGHRG